MVFPGPDFYESHAFYSSFHESTSVIHANHRYFLKIFKGFPGKLLDVGCANGSFIQEAKKIGFDVYGIDIDPVSIHVSKEAGLENTFNLDLTDFMAYCRKTNLTFDYITMFEVLEHQVDPVGFLTLLRSILTSGGILVGSVPNRDRPTFLMREIGKRLEDIDYPPHHFTLWNRNCLHLALRRAGYEGRIIVVDDFERYMNIVTRGSGRYIVQWIKTQILGLTNADKPLEENLTDGSLKKIILLQIRRAYTLLLKVIFLPYHLYSTITRRGLHLLFIFEYAPPNE